LVISNTSVREVAPTHPGEMLREDFMVDYGMTVSALASALNVSRQSVNEIVRERRSISPIMALKLSRLFGNSPHFWMQAQYVRDLWESEQEHTEELSRIEPISTQ
jgi:addiction module HigA family antidote